MSDYVVLYDPDGPRKGPGQRTERLEKTDPVHEDDLLETFRKTKSSLALWCHLDTSLVAPVKDAIGGAAATFAAVTPAESGGGDTTWGLQAIHADRSELRGRGVRVAILDTGIYAGHAAFAHLRDRIVFKDFTDDAPAEGDGAPRDDGPGRAASSHGTHVAAILCGGTVGGVRVGVAPGIDQLLVGRVLKSDGDPGNPVALFDALVWARNQNANVVSMSLRFDFGRTVRKLVENDGLSIAVAADKALAGYRMTQQAMNGTMATMRDLVVVAAVGNDSQAERGEAYLLPAAFPAHTEGVIAVGAAEPVPQGRYRVASFSNRLPWVTAPGVNVLSADGTTDDRLVARSGTSMACPHVAGVAALWFEQVARISVPADGTAIKGRMEAPSNTRIREFVDPNQFIDRGHGLVTAPPE